MPINSANSWMNPSKLSQFSQKIANFEGKPAIMREPPDVHHVLVSNIVAGAEGVRAHITVIPTPGMRRSLGRGDRDSSDVGAAVWEVFAFDEHEWYAQYVFWKIYFDPALIQTVVALAAEAATMGKMLDQLAVPRVQAQLSQARRSSVIDPTKRSS